MEKLFILFFLLVMFLRSKEGSSHGESFAPAPTPNAPAPLPAIVVQCPYCHTTSTVYGTGISRCANCGNYFEVVPTPVVITPPPLVYTPPPVYDYPYYYPYYPRWWRPGLISLSDLGAGILNIDACMDIIDKYRIDILDRRI